MWIVDLDDCFGGQLFVQGLQTVCWDLTTHDEAGLGEGGGGRDSLLIIAEESIVK